MKKKKKKKLTRKELKSFINGKPSNCTCLIRECTDMYCKGECGCKACHDGYQDFLDYE